MAAFTVIDHTELGASASSWTKSSIASSYDHLYLVASMRSDRVNAEDQFHVRLNGSTDADDYSSTYLYAAEATPDSTAATTGDFGSWKYGQAPGTSALADTFAAWTLWIPNYANTANYKQFLTATALEGASTTAYYYADIMRADLWSSPAAIDEIQLLSAVGSSNFVADSVFDLYGLTGV